MNMKSLFKLWFRNIRRLLTSSRVFKIFILLLTVLVAIFIRLQPLKYGAFINEFDPYSYYFCTSYIVEQVENKGILGLCDFFSWHQNRTWYPYGVDMWKAYHPVHPYFGAFVYFFLRFIGLNICLVEVAIYLPVAIAAITVIIMYFVGKEFGGELTGFLSALFYATSPAVIPRTTLGWYDTEMLGMPMMILSFYFYALSLRENINTKRRLLFGFLSGIFAGLMAGSWSAAFFIIGLIAIIGIVISLLGVAPRNFELSHTISVIIMIAITSILPRYGTRFIHHPLALLGYVSIIYTILSLRCNLSLKRISEIGLIRLILPIVFLVIAGIVILNLLPLSISGRLYAIVNPFYKPTNPLVQSVQEHQATSFASHLTDFRILLVFTLLGCFLILREISAKKLTLLISTLGAAYFSCSFVRLTILAAPFIIVTSSLALAWTINKIFEKITIPERRVRKFIKRTTGYKPLYTFGAVLLVIVIVLPPSFFPVTPLIGFQYGDAPVSIASASLPIRAKAYAWIDALEWIATNTPKNAVIAAWWDYGYWISFIANRTTLADNSTMNSTRIAELATMFLSNETQALKILKKLDADYVVIFVTAFRFGGLYYRPAGYAEESKFIQMARIARIPEERFINTSKGYIRYLQGFWETFLGKLMPYEYAFDDPRTGVDVYTRTFKYPSIHENKSAPVALAYDAISEIHIGGTPEYPVDLVIDVLIYKLNI